MKVILQIILISIAAYGCIILAIEMYNERLDLHGFKAVAAIIGFIPFMFLCAMIPIMIFGLCFMFLVWLFNLNDN